MESTTSAASARTITAAGLAHLIVIYLGWSGTYLAIRVAVRPDSGFPPFMLAGSRLLVAGLILLALAAVTKNRLRLGRSDWGILIISGLLLWIGGNGFVVWAEQRAESSYAALLIGSTPIWVALMESLIDRRAPTRLLVGSLVIGFGGLVVLAGPKLSAGTNADIFAFLALLAAPISWGAGSLLQTRHPLPLGPFATSALQHLVGAAGFALLIAVSRESVPAPTAEAWWGWAYLVVVGSLLTFTSFLHALRLLPTSIVFTYAYVNPVGALLLGGLVLHETITAWTLAGAALVLLGVAGVFQDRAHHKPA
ncbi:MAG: EamA family transporter [Chloroflexi bacterium]|nr:EamA family transporter [Chloroflexota bacterium]